MQSRCRSAPAEEAAGDRLAGHSSQSDGWRRRFGIRAASPAKAAWRFASRRTPTPSLPVRWPNADFTMGRWLRRSHDPARPPVCQNRPKIILIWYQRSGVERQGSRDRGRETGVESQGSGVRGQGSGVRGRRSEVRGRRSEVGERTPTGFRIPARATPRDLIRKRTSAWPAGTSLQAPASARGSGL